MSAWIALRTQAWGHGCTVRSTPKRDVENRPSVPSRRMSPRVSSIAAISPDGRARGETPHRSGFGRKPPDRPKIRPRSDVDRRHRCSHDRPHRAIFEGGEAGCVGVAQDHRARERRDVRKVGPGVPNAPMSQRSPRSPVTAQIGWPWTSESDVAPDPVGTRTYAARRSTAPSPRSRRDRGSIRAPSAAPRPMRLRRLSGPTSRPRPCSREVRGARRARPRHRCRSCLRRGPGRSRSARLRAIADAQAHPTACSAP